MSIPTALVLLSNDRLFIGSHYGDSQLVKLHTDLVPKAAYPALEKLDPWSFGTAAKAWRGNLGAQQFKPAAANSYIEPLVTYPNIGPIIDFCIVSNEGESGQGQIVTCSGSGTKSSLRIIRNGIGIEQVSGQAIQGVLGMWSLLGPSLPGTSPQSQYMVLTFVESTRVLVRREVNDKTIVLKEVDLANTGWSINERSLLVASAGPDVAVNSALAIQVTATSVRLLETESWSLVSQWTPGTIDSVSSLPGRITAASTNGSQVAVAVAKGIIVYLEVRGLNLVECDQTKLDNEVACLDIHSFTSNKLTGRSHYILVTTWCDNIVRLLSLPSLNVASEIKLDPELPLPRSVLMCQIGGVKYAMVGLGDGQLLHYVCDVVPTDNDNATAAAAPAVRLRDQRKVMLGTRPLRLIPFLNEGSLHVLVVSDRPAVIFSHHCKLMYSNVNVKSITFACAFSTQDAPNLLCLADPVSLTANKIDPIQKLHIRCVPLPRNDSPNRIAHQPSSRTFG
ncbi:DNA damage-binding protein 1a, partial [Spiromyces aspiralis]